MRDIADKFLASMLSKTDRHSSEVPMLRAIRDQALRKLTPGALPITTDESWRYTDLRSLYGLNLSSVSESQHIDEQILQSFRLPEATDLVVTVDGIFSEKYSSALSDKEFSVLSNRSADNIDTQFGLGKGLLGSLEDKFGDSFSALNTSGARDIILVTATGESASKRVIQVLNVNTKKDVFSCPRILLDCREGVEATLIEDSLNIGGYRYFTNNVVEVFVRENARLDHIQLQREDLDSFYISNSFVNIERSGTYRNWSISCGAKLSRQNPHVYLSGNGAHADLKGLALCDKGRVSDTHSTLYHAEAHTSSRQTHKNIAADQARVVFNGKIKVFKDAQGTDASQQSRSLLLSNRASIDAKPELEIFADDVKCAHGATIGQVNDEELFYLKARGIDDRTARNLLNYAFARDVLDDLPVKSLLPSIEENIRTLTSF
jgi:Fe-S cluster assembly protein SufD